MEGVIGLKEADGRIVPVFDRAASRKAGLRISPAHRGQRTANLKFYLFKGPARKKPRRFQTITVTNLAAPGPIRLDLENLNKNLLKATFSVASRRGEETVILRLKNLNPLSLAAMILYGIGLAVLIGFLVTLTFPGFSWEKLSGLLFR